MLSYYVLRVAQGVLKIGFIWTIQYMFLTDFQCMSSVSVSALVWILDQNMFLLRCACQKQQFVLNYIRLKNMHTIKNRQIVQDSIVNCP